ncbi:MAG: ORF6N domain-containing protein [Candidatus Aadella gelida]|nr:ORF6N domain-containing protein [Candidatus Aadella gelida]
MSKTLSDEDVKERIYRIRGKNVMFDKDLAELYGVPTKSLNLAVKRNLDRFPIDFMFRLTKEESLRFQIETSKNVGRGGRRYLPHVFTEQGVAMLSSILNSKRAVQVNIAIMRAFVSLKKMVVTYGELKRKIAVLEKKYDSNFQIVFTAIKKLMEPPPDKPKRRIGF